MPIMKNEVSIQSFYVLLWCFFTLPEGQQQGSLVFHFLKNIIAWNVFILYVYACSHSSIISLLTNSLLPKSTTLCCTLSISQYAYICTSPCPCSCPMLWQLSRWFWWIRIASQLHLPARSQPPMFDKVGKGMYWRTYWGLFVVLLIKML